ncbi:hypothetical protein Cgig2_001209 [Carnegiea gigantea]|uniref:Uncharacterized protein n=1 Tax=Carnegiea gigantea TaxID=171969 RepID=A0A9Q1K035_9CARY|nr:hypothetical protein Cgig2_001209 [Carnegiea gigantea]
MQCAGTGEMIGILSTPVDLSAEDRQSRGIEGQLIRSSSSPSPSPSVSSNLNSSRKDNSSDSKAVRYSNPPETLLSLEHPPISRVRKEDEQLNTTSISDRLSTFESHPMSSLSLNPSSVRVSTVGHRGITVSRGNDGNRSAPTVCTLLSPPIISSSSITDPDVENPLHHPFKFGKSRKQSDSREGKNDEDSCCITSLAAP